MWGDVPWFCYHRSMNQGTLKRCSKCEQMLPLSDFSVNRSALDGLTYQCKGCKRGRDAQRYARNRSLVNSLKDVPCMDCGVKYPPYVMQFDHVRGEKKFNIANRISRCSPKALLAEISKCQVVCGNCHAERTHTRRLISGEEDT